jgi:hypothetical protein
VHPNKNTDNNDNSLWATKKKLESEPEQESQDVKDHCDKRTESITIHTSFK